MTARRIVGSMSKRHLARATTPKTAPFKLPLPLSNRPAVIHRAPAPFASSTDHPASSILDSRAAGFSPRESPGFGACSASEKPLHEDRIRRSSLPGQPVRLHREPGGRTVSPMKNRPAPTRFPQNRKREKHAIPFPNTSTTPLRLTPCQETTYGARTGISPSRIALTHPAPETHFKPI